VNAYLSILSNVLYCNLTVKLELLTVGLNKPGINDANDINLAPVDNLLCFIALF
jgi:hypothetical protein